MRTSILFLLATLPPAFASATDLKVACTPATKYTDGSTIPATAVSTFSLYGGKDGAAPVNLVTNATSCAFTRANVAPGVQSYYVMQTTDGVDSAPSITANYTVPKPVPGTPQSVTVTVTIAVTP